MAATSAHTPEFRRVITAIEKGYILVPPLMAYLRAPDFPDFDVKVRNLGNRAPDGYFHPSEHPGYPARVLYLYLTAPEYLHYEPWDPMVNISATAGSIWHAIIQHILFTELKLIKGVEQRLVDEECGARGSMDGFLDDEAFEFKTMSPRMMGKIKTAEDFIARYPKYYLQAQEYMRMSGYQRIRVLCMVVSFPFEMIEFTIDYDPVAAMGTKTKYLQVRQAVADQRMPECGGSSCSKDCPAKIFCSSPFIGGPA